MFAIFKYWITFAELNNKIMTCSILNNKPLKKCSNSVRQSTYTLTEDNKCYIDGKYFGEVTNFENDTITVTCMNDNKFMHGTIMEIKLIKP